MAQALGALFKPPEPGKDTTHEISERDKTRIAAIEEKKPQTWLSG
jgi:hypothetical protein